MTEVQIETITPGRQRIRVGVRGGPVAPRAGRRPAHEPLSVGLPQAPREATRDATHEAPREAPRGSRTASEGDERGEGERRCAHPTCGCAAPTGEDYCSAYCANVEDDTPTAEACNCRHAGCEVVEPGRRAVREPEISIETVPDPSR